MRFVIYHNPACGTSRNVVTLVQEAGIEPIIIDYLREGWTRAHLLGLFAAAAMTARQALREKNSPARELGLLAPEIDENRLIQAMVEHPILVNRPFVCAPAGVRLCRPSEQVYELLG